MELTGGGRLLVERKVMRCASQWGASYALIAWLLLEHRLEVTSDKDGRKPLCTTHMEGQSL